MDADNGTVPGKLNQPQRNSLENVLREMENLVERSRELAAIAGDPDEDRIFTHLHVGLTSRQLRDLEKLENVTLEKLKLVRDSFELQRATEDLRHKLYVKFSLLWADLEDERPRKMLRYGKVDPEAAAILEPALQQLVELCKSFVAVLEVDER